MKALKCEMCNSSDIVKDGDFFVCQSCGTKYTVEVAKKLMVEGVVKIDNSKELENLYILARRAKDTDDYEKAKQYYNSILEKDPLSWEAAFYSVYSYAINCTYDEIINCSYTLQNCQKTILELIEKSEDTDTISAIKEICHRLKDIANLYATISRSKFDTLRTSKITVVTKDVSGDYYRRVNESAYILFVLGDTLNNSQYKIKYKKLIISMWKSGVYLLYKHADVMYNREPFTEEIKEYSDKIRIYQSDYVEPNVDLLWRSYDKAKKLNKIVWIAIIDNSIRSNICNSNANNIWQVR